MAHRVLWALEEASLTHNTQYKLKNYSRRGATTAKDLKAIFPLGKSPIITLERPDDDGELRPVESTYQVYPGTLTEARLILQFISDNYAPGVWAPETEEDKNRDVFFQEFANSTVLVKVDFALLWEVVCAQLPFPFRQLTGLLVRPIVNHFLGDLKDILQVLEDALSEKKPWFAGAKMGLADFNMSFPMDMARQRGYFKPELYPKLAKWHDAVQSRPAYKSALEKGGDYDLVNFA
jgi:glutathione S-transferase